MLAIEVEGANHGVNIVTTRNVTVTMILLSLFYVGSVSAPIIHEAATTLPSWSTAVTHSVSVPIIHEAATTLPSWSTAVTHSVSVLIIHSATTTLLPWST